MGTEKIHSPDNTKERPNCPTASQFSRYINCPGAYYYETKYGLTERPETPYTQFGTAVHAVLSLQKPEVDITPEMIETARKCVASLQEYLLNDAGLVMYWEAFKEYVKDPEKYTMDVEEDILVIMERRITNNALHSAICISSQPDLIILGPAGAVVVEYKTGKSELPNPYYNWQMRVQSVLVYNEYKGLINDVPIHLLCISPNSVADKSMSCVIDEHTVKMWEGQIKNTLNAISLNEKAPRFSGDHCTYCPALSECDTYRSYISMMTLPAEVLSVVKYDPKTFTEMGIKRWESMSPLERVNRFLMFKYIKQLIDAIEARVKNDLKSDINAYNGLITLRDGAKRREIKDLDTVLSKCGYTINDVKDIIGIKLKDLQDKWINDKRLTVEGKTKTLKSLQEEFNSIIADCLEVKETEPSLTINLNREGSNGK